MIKTLQISSILAAVLAVVLFVSSVVFGVHKDAEVEAFLNSPSVKDQFSKLPPRRANKSSGQDSPLVARAEAFGRIINPPKAPKPVIGKPTKAANAGMPVRPEPLETQAKFQILGTSFYEANPKMSLVLVDEPGKGLHWVRQGTQVMYLTIEEIKDGRIIVRDAKGTSEMIVEDKPIATSTSAASTPTVAIPQRPTRLPVPPVSSRTRAGIPPHVSKGKRGPSPITPPKSRLSTQENARLAAIGNRLKKIEDAKAKAKAAAPKPTPKEVEEGARAMEMMKKLLAEAKKDEENAKKPPSPPAPSRSRVPTPPPSSRTRSR